jgi:gliding motility-associated-like protein
MRPVSVKIFITSGMFLLAMCTLPVPAQMTSSTANYAGTLSYPVFPASDPFFVFHAVTQGSTPRGALTATPPGGTPGFDFSWSRYDPLTGNFGPPFFTQSGTASTASNLEGGCYRVHITSADLDTMLRAWVFPNDPYVEVEKGPDGKVMPYRYTCDFLRLTGTAVADTMPYYDLSTGEKLFLPNGMSFEWTSDDPEYEIFGGRLYLSLTIYNQPPYSRPPTKDTRFYLTAVDSFGLARMDNVLYESVHVRAEFNMFYEERSGDDGEGTWTESEKPEEESPLEIRFHNLSENGVEFVWSLVDSAKTGEDAIVTTTDVNDSVVYTYYVPGYYYPRMIAYSEAGCVDSFPLITNPEIHVVPSELDAPNVFTPNGDGVNDYFVVRAKSLKSFRITIYDRSGRKIYEYEHTEGRMEWEGWDGSIQGKGKSFAEPGVYYYVIDALGWDATVYRDVKPYTGFVYLFREADR